MKQSTLFFFVTGSWVTIDRNRGATPRQGLPTRHPTTSSRASSVRPSLSPSVLSPSEEGFTPGVVLLLVVERSRAAPSSEPLDRLVTRTNRTRFSVQGSGLTRNYAAHASLMGGSRCGAPSTISLFRAVNSMTSVSLHPTSHRGGRGTPTPPLPRRILPRPRRPPDSFSRRFGPPPSCLHLRRDASAGLLAGQRLRRDPHERAESRRQSHRDVPQVRVPAAHPARRADGGVRLLRAGHLPGRLRWGTEPPRSRLGPKPSRGWSNARSAPRCCSNLPVRRWPCGGCHQVIACRGRTTGNAQPHASSGVGVDAGVGEAGMPPIIACPSCQMRLQPPPGAPLVACGGCRQVMQVPGVAQS